MAASIRKEIFIFFKKVAFCMLSTLLFNGIIIITYPITTLGQTASTDIVTEKINVRRPADEKIASFRETRDFNYSRSLKPADNIWDRFVRWLGYQIEQLLQKTSYNYFWKPLFYLLLIGSIIFIIMKLFGVEIRSLFMKAPSLINIPYKVMDENIHELNLDELIAVAAEKKNFRLAVRYLYLKILKQLNDNDKIEWKPGKTNRMYAYELNKSNLNHSFEYLTTQFEYIWYGEFEVNDHSYENVKSKFIEFGNEIKN